jgi:carbon-monoxide dehydrogenase medium subunit
MKPAPFEYVAVQSLPEALERLAALGPEAKLLAGGQSLVPMLNLRLARPAWLVDLNPVRELAGIAADDGGLRFGAMTRQADAERSTLVSQRSPLLAEVLPLIAHPAIRNRGTLGGSLAHADPAAELPVAVTALDALLEVRGPRGSRTIGAEAFFVAPLTSALAWDEILTGVRIPRWEPRWGWAFQKFARRHGDFALASAAVIVGLDRGGTVGHVRIALGGVAGRPLRCRRAEGLLLGQRPGVESLDAAAGLVSQEIDPPSDVHGSAEYRRALAAALTRRALARALERAGG